MMIEVRAFREANVKCWRCTRRCRWLVGKGGTSKADANALTFIIHTCGLHVAGALDKAQKAIEKLTRKESRLLP